MMPWALFKKKKCINYKVCAIDHIFHRSFLPTLQKLYGIWSDYKLENQQKDKNY